MEDDMAFVEGTHRLPHGEWQVVIVSLYNIQAPEVIHSRWDSGVTGVFIKFPRGNKLNREVVKRMLSEVLNVSEWAVVRGPDSMQLR
jgi:hypothetical protein